MILRKKPTSDEDGDNIYRSLEGRYVQIPQVNRVLIGSLFWYFGKQAPQLSAPLVEAVFKRGPGFRSNIPSAALREIT